MKKIFWLVVLLIPLQVSANTQIAAVPMGPMFRIYYKDQTTFASSYSRPGIYTNKYRYLYRLTFKEDFYTTLYDSTEDENTILNRVNKDQLQKIKDYVLYGYEQLPVKSEACYLALQKLIYETYDYVDSLLYYSNIFPNYSECESKIIDLVNINKNGPKLTTLSGDINTFMASDDLNELIGHYQIIKGNENADFVVSHHQLIGNIMENSYTLTLSRQLNPSGKTLYYYRTSTDLIADFKFEEPEIIKLEIKANQYPIKIINNDMNNNIINLDSTVELINDNYEVIKTIDMKGSYEDNLVIPKGQYFIKQTMVNNDYMINDNLYPIYIDDNDNTIEIINNKKVTEVIQEPSEVIDIPVESIEKPSNDKVALIIKPNNKTLNYKLRVNNYIKKINKDNNINLYNNAMKLYKPKVNTKLIYKKHKNNKPIKASMFPFLIFLIMIYIKQKSLN